MNEFEQCIDEWATRCREKDAQITSLRAALDAERERYELLNVERNAIDDKRHVLHEQLANTIEAAAQQEGELAEIQALAANLESYLSQLQALVRALVCTMGYVVDGSYILTRGGVVLYACSSSISAERLGALLAYRATLPATPPAVCPDCDGEGVVDSGGTAPNGNPLMRRCGCREKGGDGE